MNIAEIVQRGILTDIIDGRVKEGETAEQISKEIGAMLGDVMSHIEFVESGAPLKDWVRKITYKVSTRSPQVVVGRGGARTAIRSLADALDGSQNVRYMLRRTPGQSYLFVFRKDHWDEFYHEPPAKGENRRSAPKG